MKTSKKKKLQAAGWKVGETTDFLKLTDEEAALIEMKLALANEIRKRRMDENLTQHDLADLIRSSLHVSNRFDRNKAITIPLDDRDFYLDMLPGTEVARHLHPRFT